tara:strand:+ start:47091 stop:47519 length:429 start_codon:yes stop_codon:yes gene_type:complete
MTNIKQFPGTKVDTGLPKEIENTEAYIMNEVLYCDSPTKTVTDFESGEQRNRRWAMTMALAVIPSFNEVTPNQAPTLLPKSPARFFTADSLKELKARVVHELDRAFELADMSVNDPEKFMEFQKSQMAQAQAPVRDTEDDMS